MTKRVKKSPNDYPLFGYRVLPTIHGELTAQLENARTALNKQIPAGQKPKKKNDVFIDALAIGFEELKKRKLEEK